MAKKSNKTEHVLKLITKEERKEKSDDVEPEAMPLEVEINVRPNEEEKDLKYETKLKIEIEPEIKIKSKEITEENIVVKLPQNSENSALINDNDNLINLAEVLAKEQLSMVMSRMNVCNCSTCTNDILALALNSLPTKYVTTDAGKQYLQIEMYKKQYETDVLAALTRACVRIKACPRH